MSMMFANRLRELRRQQSLTQEQLGEVLHVSRQTISHWETGKAQPDYETLARIADALRVPAAYFLDEQPTTPERPAPEPAAPSAPKWKLPALAAAIVCILVLIVCLVCARPAGYTMEQFAQAQTAQEGHAFLELYTRNSPVKASRGAPGADPFWKFTLFIKETNGVGVTLEELTYVTFHRNGSTVVDVHTADLLNENLMAATIGPNEVRVVNESFRAQRSEIAVGVLLKTTDDNGHEFNFHHLIPYEYTEE